MDIIDILPTIYTRILSEFYEHFNIKIDCRSIHIQFIFEGDKKTCISVNDCNINRFFFYGGNKIQKYRYT